jgi:hypothetical protein
MKTSIATVSISGNLRDKLEAIATAIMLPLLFDRFPDMEIPDTHQVIWHGFGFRDPTQIPGVLK